MLQALARHGAAMQVLQVGCACWLPSVHLWPALEAAQEICEQATPVAVARARTLAATVGS